MLCRETIYPLVVLVALLTLTGTYLAQLRLQQVRHLEADTRVTAREVAQRFEQFVGARFAVVELMENSIAVEGTITEDGFKKISLDAQSRFPGFLALNWINAEGIIEWVVPAEGNEQALGQNLRRHPNVGPLFEEHGDGDAPFTSPAIDLYQGGVGFAAYFPVASDGALLGYLNAVFRFEDLIDLCFAPETLRHYHLALMQRESVVDSMGAPPTDEDDLRFSVTEPIQVLDRSWGVRLQPSVTHIHSASPAASRALLLGSVALCFLLAAATRVFLLHERRRRELDELNRAYISAIPDLMFLYRRDGLCIDCKVPEQGLLVAPPSDLIGRRFDEVGLPDSYVAMLRDRLGEALASHEVQVFTYELDVPRGRRHFEGRIIRCGRDHALLISRDITARVEAEEERRRFEDQVLQMQKLESLGVLAGGVAHDFNNLLQGIIGNTDLAILETPPGSPAHESLELALSTARRAGDLCDQMLTYAGRSSPEMRPVDLSAVVEDMVDLLRISVPKKARLSCDLTPNLPPMLGDVTQLRQVTMNLITNASEALEGHGGEIRVSTGLSPGDSQGDQVVWLRVSDTGCGMDRRTRERLYEPFFTTKFTGRGLGMAAVRGIVQAHLGTIELESAPGQGTTFRLLFPVQSAVPEPEPDEASPSTAPVAGTCVLFVDDEEVIRDFARRALEGAGMRALLAENGQEALRIHGEHTGEIDLVILDLTMPEMGGPETLQALRERGCRAPIALSSGFSGDGTNLRFLRKSAEGFIQKPYTVEELIAFVSRTIAEHHRAGGDEVTASPPR